MRLLPIPARALSLLLAALAGCDALEPATDPVVDIAAAAHTCAVTERGAVWCWGLNTYGAVGDGTDTNRLSPVRVVGLAGITRVAAGYRHTCALDGDGRAWCWGANFNGELGDGTMTHRFQPVRVAGGLTFRTITAGEVYSCGITPSDELYCWGAWLAGGGGTGGNFDSTPTRVGTRHYLAVSAGYESACAVESGGTGNTFCWGLNTWGQLGTNDSMSTNTPSRVFTGEPFVDVQVGAGFACGTRNDRQVFCWGHNDRGQLGIDTVSVMRAPSRSAGVYHSLSARGAAHACAIMISEAYCWGLNSFGQLGDGTTVGGFAPRRVTSELVFARIAAGLFHTCGVTRDQALYCWGLGESGQLGTGDTARSAVPVRITLR